MLHAQIIYDCANGIYHQHTIYSMKNHGICTILTHVIENVLPQPLSHNIAICMDQKHTKSTCPNQIYHFTVSYIQVLEKHKRAKSSNHSHKMVTISHKPKHIYIFINKDSGQPRHEHHTCQRDQQIEYHETRHEIHSKTLYRYHNA